MRIASRPFFRCEDEIAQFNAVNKKIYFSVLLFVRFPSVLVVPTMNECDVNSRVA